MRSGTALLLLLLGGCAAPDKARWEVCVSISAETKPDPLTKVSGGLTLKRVTGPEKAGDAPATPKKPDPNTKS